MRRRGYEDDTDFRYICRSAKALKESNGLEIKHESIIDENRQYKLMATMVRKVKKMLGWGCWIK